MLLPSRGWSGAQDIVANGSAATFKAWRDPIANTWLVGHWYGDIDNSGTHGECVADAADRLDAAIATGLPLAFTEVGVPDTPLCRTVWAKVRAKVAKAANVKLVALWQFANWAPGYIMVLVRSGQPTPLAKAMLAR